ncbi:MAG: OprO/OprP family phosphate-selective porin [Pseudomonadales bacterium]
MAENKLAGNGVALLVVALGAALAMPALSAVNVDLRGRFQGDAAYHDEDRVQLDDGFLNRRTRLGVSGEVDDWTVLIEYDFAENSTTAQDVILGRKVGGGTLSIGQFKVPMGLNELTSSNSITFMERSSANTAIVDVRRLGVGYDYMSGNNGFQTMVFGRALGGKEPGDMPLGIAGRFFFGPAIGDSGRFHVGISAAYEDRQDSTTVRFRDRPEVRPDGNRLIDTGSIGAVKATTKLGLELAYQAGPFSAEAEYFRVDVDTNVGSDPTFDGYHVQGSYVLTGEARGYRNGVFRGISPASRAGAWEIAARFSSVDLIDGGFQGGEQENWTLGLNYYASSNVRFMANYIMVDVKNSGASVAGANVPAVIVGDDSPNVLAVRAQFHF